MKTVCLLTAAAFLLVTAAGCTVSRTGISAGHENYHHYRKQHKAFYHYKPLHPHGRPVIIIPRR